MVRDSTRGRLAVYAALGGTAAAVPLPWLPDAFMARVRGALAHDLAARHGVSLSPEARAVLAEPAGAEGPRGVAAQALRFLGVRLAARALARFGPFAAMYPLGHALRTYALGHLLERYLTQGRTASAVRMDRAEAERVRRSIDGALRRAFTAAAPQVTEPTVIDDQRDAVTALTDTLIALAAGLPDRLIGRLDAAFDDLLLEGSGSDLTSRLKADV